MRFIYDSDKERQAELDLIAGVRGWMLQNYRYHLLPAGFVDVESLAEQAAYELEIDRQTADDLAALVAAEVDC